MTVVLRTFCDKCGRQSGAVRREGPGYVWTETVRFDSNRLINRILRASPRPSSWQKNRVTQPLPVDDADMRQTASCSAGHRLEVDLGEMYRLSRSGHKSVTLRCVDNPDA